MHIVWVILKILLIIVLSLVGLAIALVLLVLFVPVRYKLYLSKFDSFFAKFTARWMGFVICFKAVYDSEGLNYRLRLLGGTIIDNRQKRHGKEEREQNSENIPDELDDAPAEDKLEIEEYPSVPPEEREFVLEDGEFDTPKPGIFKRIGAAIDKAFVGIVNRVKDIASRLTNLKKKKDGFTKLANNVRTKEALRVVKTQLLVLLKHLKPSKVKGRLTYGSGDPASTGQHLGYMSILFPIYGDSIDITPDFSEKILEGDLFVKGRVRIATVCWSALKVIWNKNVKITIERFKKISKGV